jgi:hypothetical protein
VIFAAGPELEEERRRRRRRASPPPSSYPPADNYNQKDNLVF